ncbi:PKD domain-containing protein [Candidatus Bathyarchaeota archaeon]|nr:PKD domain-containing protein [Candidatus Bathyarchaeota archaeon]
MHVLYNRIVNSKSVISLLCILVLAICHVPYVAQAQTANLADTINACAVNWQANPDTAKLAMIFKKLPLSYYDTLIQRYASQSDWVEVLRVKRFSEIDGYDSATVDEATKSALTNMPMLKHLPNTWPEYNYFFVYTRYCLNAYRYASQWNYETAKWNKSLAYQELLETYQHNGQPSLGYNPITLRVFQWNPRYYDESAQTLDCFVKLGDNDAGLWDYIQNRFWGGSIFGYSDKTTFECEFGFFAMIAGYYHAIMGYSLPYFDRVYLDLYNKALAHGWSSVAWGTPGVVKHASGNPQLRLENTLGAIQALHAYCGSSNWQSSFVSLLAGSWKAWNALVSSPLYSNGQFRMSSNSGVSDAATAYGMMTLFLEGIIPDTGSIAMPLNEEEYEDTVDLSPATHFQFDYDTKSIRIPVWAGDIKFQFGTAETSANFPLDGVYEVKFSNDWNTVVSVNLIQGLQEYYYLKPTSPTAEFVWRPSQPTVNETVTFASTSFAPNATIAAYQWWLGDGGQKTDENFTYVYRTAGNYNVTLEVVDNNGLTGNVTHIINVQPARAPTANFTWTPLTPKAGELVTFDASSSTSSGSIVGYEWNFGDGQNASGRTLTHTYANATIYTITLNVTDSNGLCNTEQKQVQVVQPHGPKAESSVVPETANVGELVEFNATNSQPGWNGTNQAPITEYRWDFGDGNKTTTTTPIIYHAFSSSGTYYPTLTVYASGATPETNMNTHRVTIISVPVGGYSVSMKRYGTAIPSSLHLVILIVLSAFLTAARRKTRRKNRACLMSLT